ncbi:MAG: helix-turn-helix domain-containing protein [Patescibacteria group bacterium]
MTTIGSHSKAGGLNMELLTPKELAALLHTSMTSVYRLVEGREIRFYKIKGGLRFHLKDVEAYLNQSCTEPMR